MDNHDRLTARSAPSSAAAAPQAAARRRRWRWIVGAPLATLVVVLGVSEALGWRYLRAPIASQASQAAGVSVEIGAPFRLHLLGHPGCPWAN